MKTKLLRKVRKQFRILEESNSKRYKVEMKIGFRWIGYGVNFLTRKHAKKALREITKSYLETFYSTLYSGDKN